MAMQAEVDKIGSSDQLTTDLYLSMTMQFNYLKPII
jgi:hypothetical protein